MRNATVFAVLSLLLFAFPAAAQTTPCTSGIPSAMAFNSTLLGANVASGLGSANGLANAALTLNGNQATLSVNTLALGSNISGIQLFQGMPGAGGQAVFTFTDQANTFQNGMFTRTLTLDQNLVNQILANPSNFFFVITTTDFPSGAVQGQLAPSTQQLVGGTLSGFNVSGGSPSGSGAFLLSVGPPNGTGNVTLNFDILTNGLGNNFNTLTLSPAGGMPLITVSNLSAANNGRLTGSTMVSQTVANQLLSNPCGFAVALSTPAFPNGAVAGSLVATHEIFIPVAGSVEGANGNHFQTDVNIFNNSVFGQSTASANAGIFAQFFPSGSDNANAVAQNVATVTISPRGTTTLRDISNSMFNGALNGIGALRIISSGSVLANARIYDNQIASGRGTFGQFEPGMLRGQAMQQGVLVGVGNVGVNGAAATGGQTFRTNIGLFNPNDTPTTVAFELRDSGGNVTANRTLTLAPWMHMQVPLSGTTGVFNAVSGDVANSSVYFLSGNPIFAYASIVDNISGDASFVTPEWEMPSTP